MTGLDSNVLVCFLTRDDPAQFERARKFLETLQSSEEPVRLDAIVLCELAWVLASGYEYDRSRIADALDALLDAGLFEIDDRELTREAIARSRVGGDFADHLVGLRNLKAGCTRTVTFDRKLWRSPGFERL